MEAEKKVFERKEHEKGEKLRKKRDGRNKEKFATERKKEIWEERMSKRKKRKERMKK